MLVGLFQFLIYLVYFFSDRVLLHLVATHLIIALDWICTTVALTTNVSLCVFLLLLGVLQTFDFNSQVHDLSLTSRTVFSMYLNMVITALDRYLRRIFVHFLKLLFSILHGDGCPHARVSLGEETLYELDCPE